MKLIIEDRKRFRPPPLGCVLSLPGHPGTGGRIYDTGPGGHVGAITGATWQCLPSGLRCLKFDGVDDYVNCGNAGALNMSGDFTVEAWINVNNPGGNNEQAIAWKKADGGFTSQYGWGAYVQLGRIYVNFGKSGGYQEKSAVVTLSGWMHIAVGLGGSPAQGKIFWNVNGTPLSSQTVTGIPQASTDNLVIGRIDAGSWLDGLVALPRIYRRALTALEAQRHFNEERGLFGI